MPLMVTENGAAYPDTVDSRGRVEDADRIAYLSGHLRAAHAALAEGVDLRGVPAGDYEIMCLPLKYEGGNGDGAPARTFLRELA